METDEQSARRVADLFAENFGDDAAVSLTEARPGTWRVTLYFHSAVDEATVRAQAAAALTFETIAAKDWVAESLSGLKPVAAGRFVVHGAHDRGAVPPNRIGIEIEAALAFGTGHHGTTRGCLLALGRLCKTLERRRRANPLPSPWKGEGQGGDRSTYNQKKITPTRLAFAHRPPPFRGRNLKILDLGTGTGVLAIAAARSGHARVLATDIDAAAVRAARANAQLNRAGALVEVLKANGVTAAAIRARAPFDLVFANILLGPLRRLASPLTNVVAPGGHLVLSGLLTAQVNAALAAYHAFRLERRIVLDGWATLVLKRDR